MKKILVVGSINMDLVTYVNHMPVKGETITGESFMSNPGGKGANQACAAALAGGDVTMIGSIGKDSDGKQLIKTLKECNVKDRINESDVHTGVASIIIETSTAENRIIVVPGANYDLKISQIDVELIKQSDIIILQLEIPLEVINYVARIGKENGKIVILNPAPAKPLSNELLANVTYLTPNETELSILSQMPVDNMEQIKQACNSLINKGVSNLIVTLGKEGALYYNSSKCELVKAFKVKAIDTTAAGDCFNGVFATFLANGYEVVESITYANKAASLAVCKKGAIASLPKKEEIKL